MYSLNEIDGVGSQVTKCLGSDWECHFSFVQLMNIGFVQFHSILASFSYPIVQF